MTTEELLPLLVGAALAIFGGWATSALTDGRNRRRQRAEERRECYEELLDWAARIHGVFVTLWHPSPGALVEMGVPPEERERYTGEWQQAEEYLQSGEAEKELRAVIDRGRFYLVASRDVDSAAREVVSYNAERRKGITWNDPILDGQAGLDLVGDLRDAIIADLDWPLADRWRVGTRRAQHLRARVRRLTHGARRRAPQRPVETGSSTPSPRDGATGMGG